MRVVLLLLLVLLVLLVLLLLVPCVHRGRDGRQRVSIERWVRWK